MMIEVVKRKYLIYLILYGNLYWTFIYSKHEEFFLPYVVNWLGGVDYSRPTSHFQVMIVNIPYVMI